ncbi:MAG: hypothetical protein QOH06_615 [Acidobacteriota bacterium]|nr:hypothetical protein [Acidobacteriota bacterium]
MGFNKALPSEMERRPTRSVERTADATAHLLTRYTSTALPKQEILRLQ